MTGIIGMILPFAGKQLPENWLYCDGSTLRVDEYASLYSVIKYRFGGSNSFFALPDLRSRVAIGSVNKRTNIYDNYVELGEKGGLESVELKVENLPSHKHTVKMSKDAASASSPQQNKSMLMAATGYLKDNAFYPTNGYNDSTPDRQLWVETIHVTGPGKAHNNLQPYLVCNYIICFSGTMPNY